MRQISLSLIVLAFIVNGCSKKPEPTVQEEVFIEEVTPAPVESAAPAATATQTEKATVEKESVAPQEPNYYQEEEATSWERDPEDSQEIKKTYNELQKSPDKGNSPMSNGAPQGRTYNESQVSD